jgi:hypothetical protein
MFGDIETSYIKLLRAMITMALLIWIISRVIEELTELFFWIKNGRIYIIRDQRRLPGTIMFLD